MIWIFFLIPKYWHISVTMKESTQPRHKTMKHLPSVTSTFQAIMMRYAILF